MRIWHVGCSKSPLAAGGIDSAVWTLARAQAEVGHDVYVLHGDRPDHASAAAARRLKVTTLYIPSNGLRFHPRLLNDVLHSEPPDIVHMHTAFVPRLATLARALTKRGIPYVVTPHAGLSPNRLGKASWRTAIYSRLVEKPRIKHAAGITLVGPGEEDHVNAFVGSFRKPMRWIPNPVPIDHLRGLRWTQPTDKKRVVFFGRFDVHSKGLDLLAGIAKYLPDVEMHLYGVEDPRSLEQLEHLKREAKANLFFRDPVFGAERAAVIAGATIYIQMSRWEGFPAAVTEAMHLGVPCAVSEDMAVGPLFKQHDLGMLLPADGAGAATMIGWAMDHPERLRQWGENARQYAAENLTPTRAAADFMRLYREAMPSASAQGLVGEWLTAMPTLAGLAMAL